MENEFIKNGFIKNGFEENGFEDGVFTKRFDIHFHECDKNHKLKLEALLRYIADMAGIAYAEKGYSHEWLWEHNFVFLLSRVAVEIKTMPKADETITIKTWEREVKGVIFYRDVEIYDKDGNLQASASTAWSLVDPRTRTIVKPSCFTGKIDPNPNKKADCPQAIRIKDSGELEEVGKRKVVYSDIDGNGHVYNAVYAGIACDFLQSEYMERDLFRFFINFKAEALLGEALTIKTKCEAENAYVSGFKGDGKESFVCEFIFA